jgi:hypothetical protein
MRYLTFCLFLCVSASAWAGGNGTVTATTTSALINTMTVNAAGNALPSKLNTLVIVNLGSVDAAICPNPVTAGATCTCPENGVANTNGLTLPTGFGGYVLNLGSVGSANPTVVACSSTVKLQFSWY